MTPAGFVFAVAVLVVLALIVTSPAWMFRWWTR